MLLRGAFHNGGIACEREYWAPRVASEGDAYEPGPLVEQHDVTSAHGPEVEHCLCTPSDNIRVLYDVPRYLHPCRGVPTANVATERVVVGEDKQASPVDRNLLGDPPQACVPPGADGELVVAHTELRANEPGRPDVTKEGVRLCL